MSTRQTLLLASRADYGLASGADELVDELELAEIVPRQTRRGE